MSKAAAGFFRKQIFAENVLRFAGGSDFHEGHIHPFYYMEMALLAGFMPWTILLPLVAIQAKRQPHALDSRFRYLLVWFIAVLVFYNFPQSKRGVYLLCLYPAFATLVAIYVCDAVARPEVASGWVRGTIRLCGFALLLAGAAMLVAFAILLRGPRRQPVYLPRLTCAPPPFRASCAEPSWSNGSFRGDAARGHRAGSPDTHSPTDRTDRNRSCRPRWSSSRLRSTSSSCPPSPTLFRSRDFTDHAMKIVNGNRVGYLSAMNYDVAFYSRRTIPITTIRDPNRPEYLIAGGRSSMRFPVQTTAVSKS